MPALLPDLVGSSILKLVTQLASGADRESIRSARATKHIGSIRKLAVVHADITERTLKTMSDSYAIGCNDCKTSMTIGQAAGDSPFCFYYGEPETMKKLRDFFYAHFHHNLIFEFSDVLWDKYDIGS